MYYVVPVIKKTAMYCHEYKDKKDSWPQGVYSLEGERNMQENSSDMSLK